MAKENIADLSTSVLKRRKRFVTFIIGLTIGVMVVDLVILGISLVKNETINYAVILPAVALLVIVMPMGMGLKKINAELVKRSE